MHRVGILTVCIILLFSFQVLKAQDSRYYDFFTHREYADKDGVSFIIDVDIEIQRVSNSKGNYSTLFGSDNFRVTLKNLETTFNGCEECGVKDPNSELRPLIDALKVTSIGMTVMVEGLKDCETFSYAAWKPEDSMTRFCEQTGSLNIYKLNISSIATSGIAELKAKIKQLKAKESDAEKVTTLLEEANRHLLYDRYREAIDKYEEVLQIDPNNEQAIRGRTSAKEKLEKGAKKESTDKNKEDDKEEKKEQIRSSYNPLMHASELEMQGDAFLKAGNAQAAVQKYSEANKVMYSEDRAKKLEMVAVQGIAAYATEAFQQLSKALADAEKRLDPEGKFDWKFIGLHYETAIPGSKGIAFSQPAVDLELSFLSFALGFKFGYAQNEMQYFNVEMINFSQEQIIPEQVILASKGVNMELLVGLNIPFKNFSIRPMYGYPLITGNDFSIKGNDDFKLNGTILEFKTSKVNRASLGIYYQIPRTTIGLGLHLNYLMQRRYHFGFDKAKQIKLDYIGDNTNYQNASEFYVANPKTNEKEGVGAFTTGFSFIFGISKKR